MHREVRIAVAGFFVVLALSFIALWARSYAFFEVVTVHLAGYQYKASSNQGIIQVRSADETEFGAAGWHSYRISRRSTVPLADWWDGTLLGFAYRKGPPAAGLFIPYWCIVALLVALAASFPFKRTWRFTIRRLLIATALLAGVLGMAVYVFS